MSNKDWTGNSNSIYKTLGASNHTEEEREQHDFYATEPKATKLLLELEDFSPTIWECACGAGDMSKVLEEAGHNVVSTDLIDRGYGKGGVDFLATEVKNLALDIVTNPPYKFASQFVEKAINVVGEGHKVAMFLKLQFLEGKARRQLFEKYPPKTIYVSSSRLLCAKNGEFDKMKAGGGSAVCYCWYIWEKNYNGNTTLKWFN